MPHPLSTRFAATALIALLAVCTCGCSHSSSPSGDIASQAARRRELVAKRTTRTTVVIPERPTYVRPSPALPDD